MELRIVLLPLGDQVLPLFVFEKIARSKSVVNALQLLDNDAPGTHVEMSYLARSLITVRQANGFAAAIQKAMRIPCADLIDDGSLRPIHRIAVLARIDAPAVANYENHRSHCLFLLEFCMNLLLKNCRGIISKFPLARQDTIMV